MNPILGLLLVLALGTAFDVGYLYQKQKAGNDLLRCKAQLRTVAEEK